PVDLRIAIAPFSSPDPRQQHQQAQCNPPLPTPQSECYRQQQQHPDRRRQLERRHTTPVRCISATQVVVCSAAAIAAQTLLYTTPAALFPSPRRGHRYHVGDGDLGGRLA
ncbi:unnamed protein product, partial [Ectocarpus sp. 12 AP-2014]